MAEVAQKVLTWDEYVRGEPADLERYEIVDGVVIELPAPSVGHQRVVRRLLRLLEDFVSSRNLGEVLPAPLDVVVQQNPVRTRQPDLLFVRAENVPILESQQERLEFAPDLVIEVLSPSDSVSELFKKLSDYHRIGVKEVWLVNLLAKTVEVLVWRRDDWELVGVFKETEIVQSRVLSELSLPVVQIFEGA
ncbi:Uma2 family endonuclease [Fervidibacter sacchari]